MKRLKALTLQLLPLEVDPQKLRQPTSTIITPQVIAAYQAAAGDFTEAVSYFCFGFADRIHCLSATLRIASRTR